MTVYLRDRSFSVGWVIGGTVLMFLTNAIGGVLAAVFGVTSVWVTAAIGLGCFLAGGFIIGWKSEGRTIIEAGLAGACAAAISTLVLMVFKRLPFSPVGFLIGLVLPFSSGLLGGWIGEMVQGDTIDV